MQVLRSPGLSRSTFERSTVALWPPDAVVELRLLPSDAGGRAGPTPAGWWGCPLSIDGDLFDGRFDLSETGPMWPGESRVVHVKFLSPNLGRSRIVVGQELRVWETKFIGDATVLTLRW